MMHAAAWFPVFTGESCDHCTRSRIRVNPRHQPSPPQFCLNASSTITIVYNHILIVPVDYKIDCCLATGGPRRWPIFEQMAYF